jgi:hypothetical protein
MSARTLRPRHQQEIKDKIATTQLVKFLENHALSGDKEIKQTRIDAAKFLLNKTLSNAPTEIAQTTELSGKVEIEHSQRPKLTREEWLKSLDD